MTSQGDEDTEEEESPDTASSVEERFRSGAPVTEGPVITASIVESALIPAPVVEPLIVSSIATVIIAALARLAEVRKARLLAKPALGRGGSAAKEPQRAQA